MLSGIGCSLVSLLALTQLPAGAPYVQLLVSLVLMGIGAGSALVTLTSASLAGVAPEDAGAASGLVNVAMQVGGALGLAVLVTVSSAATTASAAAGRLASTRGAEVASLSGLDVVFGASAIFAVAAFMLVATMVRLPAPSLAPAIASAPEALDAPDVESSFDDAWLADAVA